MNRYIVHSSFSFFIMPAVHHYCKNLEKLIVGFSCLYFHIGSRTAGTTLKWSIEYKEDPFDILGIVWCYNEWQRTYNILHGPEKSRFVSGIPTDDDGIVGCTSFIHLIVFLEMLGDKDEKKIRLWLMRKWNHKKTQVWCTSYRIYFKQKKNKNISNDQSDCPSLNFISKFTR